VFWLIMTLFAAALAFTPVLAIVAARRKPG
jgi:hypothetical protein